jgi:hypothetical protein
MAGMTWAKSRSSKHRFLGGTQSSGLRYRVKNEDSGVYDLPRHPQERIVSCVASSRPLRPVASFAVKGSDSVVRIVRPFTLAIRARGALGWASDGTADP